MESAVKIDVRKKCCHLHIAEIHLEQKLHNFYSYLIFIHIQLPPL